TEERNRSRLNLRRAACILDGANPQNGSVGGNHVLRTHHLHGNRRTALRSALSVLNLQCRDRSPDCDRYRERSGSDAGQSRLSRDPWQKSQQTHSKVRLVNLYRHAEKLSEAEDQLDLHWSPHASPGPVFCYEASAASSASAAE